MDQTKLVAENLNRWMGETPGLDTLLKVSAKSGVGYGTVRRIKLGEGNPTYQNLEKIARAFGRSADDLLRRPGAGLINTDPATLTVRAVGTATGDVLGTVITIPHMASQASMGEGLDLTAEDTVIDRMVVKRDWLMENLPGVAYSKLAIISGKGDSMCPTFCDGDLLLVDTSRTSVDIDGVYVLSAHQRLFIKRVRQRIDGQYEVSSDNTNVKTVDILNGDHEVTIHGRVVWAWNGKKL